ncbi:MAG: CHAT domain-containing protein [Pseudomonadota bacterium]
MSYNRYSEDLLVNQSEFDIKLVTSGSVGSANPRRRARGAKPTDPLATALQQAGFEQVHELQVGRKTRQKEQGERRRSAEHTAASGDLRSDLALSVSSAESAVLLIEADGVFSWQAGSFRSDNVQNRRSAVRSELLHFALDPSDLGVDRATGLSRSADARDGRRGLLEYAKNLVVEKIIVRVLRFGVTRSIDTAVKLIEEDKATGPVPISNSAPQEWTPANYVAPIGKPIEKILLLIHGTFSSSQGGFGGLSQTPAGQRFLSAAAAEYDLVCGFDHKTLVNDPQENAEQILSFLQSLDLAEGVKLDAISHSRGGLVYRVLAESLLPNSGLSIELSKSVFVGCTNSGTNLASPENWSEFVDFYTNLTLAGTFGLSVATGGTLSPIATGAIKAIGRFVQMFSEVAIEERRVPGLAAMEPSGAFVQTVNRRNESTSKGLQYYVVASEFEPNLDSPKRLPKKLLGFLADRLSDRLLSVRNDVVVNTDSMSDFGQHQHLLAEEGVVEFGAKDEIYHTLYFDIDEVAKHCLAWLELPDRLIAKGPVPVAAGGGGQRRSAIKEGSPTPAEATQIEGVEGLIKASAKDFRSSFRQTGYNFSVPAKDSAFSHHIGLTELLNRGGNNLEPKAGNDTILEKRFGEPAVARDNRREMEADPVPNEAANPGLVSGPQAIPAKRYFAAEMPPRPSIARLVPVNLYITQEQTYVAATPTGKASDTAVEVDKAQPVIARIHASSGCQIVGDSRKDIDVSTEISSTTFFVYSDETGEADILIEVMQGNRDLASFKLQPKFVRDGTPVLRTSSAGVVAPRKRIDHPVLRIYERTRGNGDHELKFVLESKEPSKAFDIDHIIDNRIDLRRNAEELLSAFEDAWKISENDYENFVDEFADQAISRTDAIIPEQIRRWLWESRDEIQAIQIIADEPNIPWELLYIAGEGPDDERRGFLAEWGIIRWLHGVPPPKDQLSFDPEKCFFVGPEGQGLSIDAERDALRKAIGGIDELEPTSLALKAFLKKNGPDCDLLHFACHGVSEDKSVFESRINLRDKLVDNQGNVRTRKGPDGQLYPIYDSLTIDAVNARANFGQDGAGPIIFLNCCQTGRPGDGLAGTSGFAKSFLQPRSGAGAAVFVGALWSILDDLSTEFAKTFYTELTDGAQLVDAAKKAREAAKGRSDFTWLSYTIYGDPFATLKERADA